MPNPTNRLTGQQWDQCQRCGFWFPLGELTIQKGLKLCTVHCTDDLTVERRYVYIDRLLNAGNPEEGADLRWVDGAFFRGMEDVEF